MVMPEEGKWYVVHTYSAVAIRNIVIGIIVVISVLLDVVVRSGKPRRKKEKSSSEVKSKNVGVKA